MRSPLARRVAMLLILACFGHPQSGQGARSSDVFALELLNRIKAQEFKTAAAMFHYPPNQSAAERDADRADVARWIQGLSRELGPLQSFKPQQPSVNTEAILSVSIAGGDVPYWASRGKISTVAHVFKASWRNEPDTRVTVHIMENDKGWAVQSLHCGVFASRPDAKEFMLSLASKLMPPVR